MVELAEADITAPGQAAVLYDGDLVLGSATIKKAHRLAATPA